MKSTQNSVLVIEMNEKEFKAINKKYQEELMAELKKLNKTLVVLTEVYIRKNFHNEKGFFLKKLEG